MVVTHCFLIRFCDMGEDVMIGEPIIPSMLWEISRLFSEADDRL